LRERLSPEHWGLVHRMAAEWPQRMAGPCAAPQLLAALDGLGEQLAAVTGAQTDRMTRDHGWRLLSVGRLAERLIGMAQSLGLLLEGGALDSLAGVDVLLALFDSTITYRARYQRHQELIALADLLVLDAANPRAWAGVLRRLRSECAKLPGEPAAIDALLSRLPSQGAGLTLDELRTLSEAGLRDRLVALSVQLAEAGAALSDDIGRRYFAHAEGGDQLQQV